MKQFGLGLGMLLAGLALLVSAKKPSRQGYRAISSGQPKRSGAGSPPEMPSQHLPYQPQYLRNLKALEA